MSGLLDALRSVEASLSVRQGAFELFGLFRPRRALDWDVVVAAPWTDPGERATIELVIDDLKRVAGTPVLLLVSRIIVGPDRSFLDAVHATVTVEHGLEVVGPGDYGGIELARGYVITSRRPAAVLTA